MDSSASSAAPAAAASQSTAHADSTNLNSSQVLDSRATSPTKRRKDERDFSRGRGRGFRGDRGGKKRDMGRSEWAKKKVDKRQRNDTEQAAKRQRLDKGDEELPIYATKFSDEQIAAEARKPKKKVAVLIGYAGTGYKGMQLAHDQKTIEGDLFQAFVAAGAIAKANADDPKKSSFVRCARTDKGVHAAGNVISLKLIVEDEDIVKKINDNLTPQIRVWGYVRTNNSFSAYQLVDSRIYEYLIPSHSFLPPHPSSFLAKRCEEWAEKKGDVEAYRERQKEVEGYWEKVDEEIIKPILQEYDEETRSILQKALWLKDEPVNGEDVDDRAEGATSIVAVESSTTEKKGETDDQVLPETEPEQAAADTSSEAQPPRDKAKLILISEASKRLRQAYVEAKRRYRIPETRLNRIQDTLNLFLGTKNHHNYTVQKTFNDPSAKRVIKTFNLNKTPILINGTEWLSMKVHGQSFMMHQIRKMVGMVSLIVRCGCDPKRLTESLGPDNISIPKAPSLGLLLERPIFDSYNKRAISDFGKEALDFDLYKTEMDKFKQEQIYERMYRDEEKDNTFGNFFNHIDNFPNETFLYLTSGGFEASRTPVRENRDEGGKSNGNGVLAKVEIDSDGNESDAEQPKDALGDEG